MTPEDAKAFEARFRDAPGGHRYRVVEFTLVQGWQGAGSGVIRPGVAWSGSDAATVE